MLSGLSRATTIIVESGKTMRSTFSAICGIAVFFMIIVILIGVPQTQLLDANGCNAEKLTAALATKCQSLRATVDVTNTIGTVLMLTALGSGIVSFVLIFKGAGNTPVESRQVLPEPEDTRRFDPQPRVKVNELPDFPRQSYQIVTPPAPIKPAKVKPDYTPDYAGARRYMAENKEVFKGWITAQDIFDIEKIAAQGFYLCQGISTNVFYVYSVHDESKIAFASEFEVANLAQLEYWKKLGHFKLLPKDKDVAAWSKASVQSLRAAIDAGQIIDDSLPVTYKYAICNTPQTNPPVIGILPPSKGPKKNTAIVEATFRELDIF